MSAKKASNLTPEEEIERDYRKYKEQFEQWKEANRNAVGTEAYNKYVQQFEDWERDVEKRKANLKKKVEVDKNVVENEEAAAKAYAQQHEHYIRMHQKGMVEDTMRSRMSATNLKAHASPVPLNSTPIKNDISSLSNALQNVIQSVIKTETRIPTAPMQSQSATISAPPLMKSQQPPAPAVQQPIAPKPVQLWWTRQAEYGPHDKLFRIFGPRAAPMTTKQPISDNYDYYVPGWLVQQEMGENDLVFPSPAFTPARTLHPSKTDPPKQIPALMSIEVPLPSDFSIPPPIFRSNLPPPSLPMMTQPPPPLHMPMFNPNIPPPPFNMAIPPPSMGNPLIPQLGMKRNHSFPGRQMDQPMHIPPQRG